MAGPAQIRWTRQALADLVRLHEFLAPVNRQAADRIVRSLSAAPLKLLDYPRRGRRLEEFAPREVRRVIVGAYEIRYEIEAEKVIVLRLWHTRENR